MRAGTRLLVNSFAFGRIRWGFFILLWGEVEGFLGVLGFSGRVWAVAVSCFRILVFRVVSRWFFVGLRVFVGRWGFYRGR